MNYKTPGVYVEEVSKFPPSVAQVETAIPAFIGNTEKGSDLGPTRITSMLEYEKLFGSQSAVIEVTISGDSAGASIDQEHKMYLAMQLYFANGGGPCYVVPASDSIESLAAIAELEKEDEPTLLVFPDSTDSNLYKEALAHAKKMGDRFVIMDVTDVSTFRDEVTADDLSYGAAYYPSLQTSLTHTYDSESVTVTGDFTGNLKELKSENASLYNAAKAAIASKSIDMQPSSAIAGVYARVDSTSGVWKAPANVGLNYVIAPTIKISSEEQKGLNVDAVAGKSINAIRSFTGKGTLVWGARTLDGNSNEWRYVSVRRFFNMVEESVKNATERFVFEANTANTWVRVKAMIENFLNQQWRDGALAGATPEDAYYVSVGLGETMTAQDVLEGRMNVEIGMAAVRPAEFIVLKFSHKLQES